MAQLGRLSTRFWVSLAAVLGLALGASAQVNTSLVAGLQWRNIGPYHGGRVASVTGVIGEPGTFYAGMPQGGIWKTTSAGTTWFPIADQITEVDSWGAVQVAPSDPNVIYAGSGDAVSGATTGTDGDGMYKSVDAGKTWTRIGLEGTAKIPKIIVDAKNPNIVIAIAMGGTTGTQRGIFRTEDGGKTWQNVLHPDDQTGGRDLSQPFDMPNVIFATTEADGAAAAAATAAGRGGPPPAGPTHTRLYKSLDEGKTWTELTNNPSTTGRIAVAVAMHTNGQRIFVIGGNGLYRSDDQGATWRHMAADDTRMSGRDYICGVWVDSQNPDMVYTMSTSTYRSTDGGETFNAFKGAPGGEDHHDIWIDPTNGRRMLLGTDQGPSVTLDGGQNWSSYFNAPVAQIYHLSTDDRYPYWVLGAQQDTGAIMVRARGDWGSVTEMDWLPLPSSEFGTVTPDPIDPNIVYGVGYGAGQGPGLIKINLYNGQWDNINPGFGAESTTFGASSRDQWRHFDPFDPHTLYADFQCLVVSHDQGQTWTAFSPALTTTKDEPQEKCGTQPEGGAAAGRGRAGAGGGGGGGRGGASPSINDFAIGTARKGVFWTVSANGQIFNSVDAGKTWSNVSNITDAPQGAQLMLIEAGHTDINTAYVSAHAGGTLMSEAANVPLIWRTHDGGKTWTKVVNGLPSGQHTGSWVNVVREDPKQKGLLFAGTESAVYVSFDDGDHWQSLQLNMPTTSIRDMVFHTNDHMSDLVIATYGRGFYVLDDTTPLRELATKAATIAAAPAYMFQPGDAIRARFSATWSMPLQVELPYSPNPPFGVVFYYHLSRPPQGEITMQILDAQGNVVRHMTSLPPALPDRWPYPSYWVAKPSDLALPVQVGTDRFNWDLRYDDPPAFNLDLENQMNVEPGSVVTPGPHGPFAMPGLYTLKLMVDGETYTRTVTVRNDPRVGESPKIMAGIEAKNRVILLAYKGAKDSYAGNAEVAAVRAQLASLAGGQLPAAVGAAATALDAKLATFGGVAPGRGGRGGGGGGGRAGRGGPPPGGINPFNTLNGSFNQIVSLDQNGDDNPPSQAVISSWEADCKDYNATVAAWKAFQTQDAVAFNAQLTGNNLPPLRVPATALSTTASCRFVPPAAPAASKPGANNR